MPVVKRIRNRGANITVESHAEIMFMPGGQVHNWANRFTGRIRAATIAEAPINKRPRWGHYGKPLKDTIVSARPRFWGNGRDRQRVYAAVGATAPHSYYVDQGTGVYAGRGAYEAKILPPWQHNSASLYEATWRPNGPGHRRVGKVMIKGQKGQHFFDAGLKRAFQSMRMRSAQVPGEPKIADAANSVATGLENFAGNTPSNAAFRASLKEWRAWRDAAWDAGEGLGRGGGVGSRSHAKFKQSAAEHREAKLAAVGKGRAAYEASKAAAARRHAAEVARIKARREAKARGEKKAREEEARIAFVARQNRALNAARTFGRAKSAKGYTVSGSWVVKNGATSGFRVTWTSKSGVTKSRVFKV